MEIGRSHLGRMVIMIVLTLLANQVHSSTQSLDHITHLLQAYVPISFVGTPHNHFSPNQDPGEIDKATHYPWQELLGKPLWQVVEVINQVAPSASIVVKKMDMPATVLQQKGLHFAVLLFTDYSDFVTGISLAFNY